MQVRLIKRANMLEVTPAVKILHLLVPELTYKRILPKYGKELYASKSTSRVTIEEVSLYQLVEEEDKLYTFAGFLTRLTDFLRLNQHEVILEEADKRKEFEPQLERLAGINLRMSQEEMLAIILSYERAQLNGLTAMGKTFLIKQICKLFPYPDCNIVICAQQRPIVEAICRDLSDMFPGQIGMCGCGRNNPQRITVSTAKSLLKCDVERCYMLLYDEVHTAAGDCVSKALTNFMWARMYGFSASTECRSDKADKMVEALFGPVRCKITYEQGVDEGIVPEIDTYFYKTKLQPFSHRNPTIRKRHQVWNNPVWNDAIASIARYWEQAMDSPQILILTDTLEHVLRIRKMLPDYEIIYGSSDSEQIEEFKRKDLLPFDYVAPSRQQMKERIWTFEGGGLRKVISTTTLGTGVDLRHLDVMIRADGGSSEISNIQFRGRVTRGQSGVYCDILAEGDDNEADRSLTRMRSCKAANWKVRIEELPKC